MASRYALSLMNDSNSIRAIQTRLALSAFLLLFVELALIRWLGANVIYLAYFSNFVLVGSFLGIGLGFLWAGRFERSLFPLAPVALALFVLFIRLAGVNVEVGGSDLIFFADQRPVGPPRWLILTVIFIVAAAIIACIADGVARSFAKLEPLEAYRWDLIGSISGVIGFSVLSFLGAPPIIWGVVAGLLFLGLLHDSDKKALLVRLVAVFLLFGVLAEESIGEDKAWSPYYALSWEDNEVGGIDMSINDVGTWKQFPVGVVSPYSFVHDVRTADSPGDVLIIGAGSGNDVSEALARGANRVDAVEIDPLIHEIASKNHPDDPYADPRVFTHINDGRAFLERTDRQWDMILLALPDSLTVVLGQGSVRLESYLFTEEALASYNEHLRPGGVFGMYNFMRERWLVDRYASTLDQEFDEPPCVVDFEDADHFSILVATDNASSIDCSAGEPEGALWMASSNVPDPVSDDHPFPYLRTAHIPSFYLLTIGLILAVSAVAVRMVAGPLKGIRRQTDVFFMGLAFLLLETKNVVQFALLFGTTWFVNALVFVSLLGSVLAAVEVSRRIKFKSQNLLYGFLALSLVLNWLVPASWLLSLGPTLRLFVGGGIAFLPVFIANLIFADRFRDEKESTTAFGANLLGAVVGGLLEYMALLMGYRSLLFIVAGAYLIALFATRKSQQTIST